MRTGLIAQKAGHDPGLHRRRRHVPGDRAAGGQLPGRRPAHRGERTATPRVQLGAGAAKVKNVTKADARPFRQGQGRAEAQAGRVPRRRDAMIDVGAELTADHFVAGQFVDVDRHLDRQGLCRRHEAAQFRRPAGQRTACRSATAAHGSTGQCQDPGKVFKGKKMAGQMGDARVTTQNLEVVKTDVERGLILVKGAVPGSKGGWVLVKRRGQEAAAAGRRRGGARRKPAAGEETPPKRPRQEAAAEEKRAAAERPRGRARREALPKTRRPRRRREPEAGGRGRRTE